MTSRSSGTPSHLTAVAKLNIRLARLYGDSLSTIARNAGVTVRTVVHACRCVPKAPRDFKRAEDQLRALTLRELGADETQEALWLGLKLATAGPVPELAAPAVDDDDEPAAAMPQALAFAARSVGAGAVA